VGLYYHEYNMLTYYMDERLTERTWKGQKIFIGSPTYILPSFDKYAKVEEHIWRSNQWMNCKEDWFLSFN
jgi:hypothetical protein